MVVYQSKTPFLRPLTFSKHQGLITTICFHALPCNNTITIGIHFTRNTINDFFLQLCSAGSLYNVIHIFTLFLSGHQTARGTGPRLPASCQGTGTWHKCGYVVSGIIICCIIILGRINRNRRFNFTL